MKTLLFLVFFCFLFLGTNIAQEENSYRYIVGGQFSASGISNTKSERKNSAYYVAPVLGYIFNEKLIIGGKVGYLYRYGQSNNDNFSRNYRISITPFIRNTFWKKNDFRLYGEVGLPIASVINKSQVSNNTSKQTQNSLGIYLGPGIEYQLSERWVINLLWGAIDYTLSSASNTDGHTHSWGLNFNLDNTQWGVNYRF